jgi:hypothetical protein
MQFLGKRRTWWQKILYISSTTTVEKEELAYLATPRDAAYYAIGGTLPTQRSLVNMSNQCVTLNTQECFFSEAMDSSPEPSSSDRSSFSELPITTLSYHVSHLD